MELGCQQQVGRESPAAKRVRKGPSFGGNFFAYSILPGRLLQGRAERNFCMKTIIMLGKWPESSSLRLLPRMDIFGQTGRLERTGGPERRTRLAVQGGMTRTSVTNCPVSGPEVGSGAIKHGIASCKILRRLNWRVGRICRKVATIVARTELRPPGWMGIMAARAEPHPLVLKTPGG